MTIEILFTEIIHLVSQYFEQSQKTKISQSLSLALVLVQLSNACSLFQPFPPPPSTHTLSPTTTKWIAVHITEAAGLQGFLS